MLFNSYLFIFLFLPVTVLVYFLLNSLRLTLAAKSWLILGSLVFYSYWNIRFLPLILASILVNYSFGYYLRKGSQPGDATRKTILFAGILTNLLVLGYYKYADFFISNINLLSGSQLGFLKLILPLGISFFTFTQIAYLVDSYRNVSVEKDFLNYILFVTYFPHLIAGPIVHHKELMPQFDRLRNKTPRFDNIARGIFIFSLGLFKKTMIADSLAVLANSGYANAASLDCSNAWVTSLAYTFQLYFDFSGYMDMALGASLLFNIVLPKNFNSPYKALDIQDFWRRWHMTLSRFLRDYVYIPLGGNRGSEAFVARNLLLTFVIGGFWHGASWTFVFWGFLHGMAVLLHRMWTKIGIRLHPLIAWLLTFNFVNLSWVFFRAKSWHEALSVLRAMLGLTRGTAALDSLDLTKRSLILFSALLIVLLFGNSDKMKDRFQPTGALAIFTVFLSFIALLGMTRVSEFLYFNF